MPYISLTRNGKVDVIATGDRSRKCGPETINFFHYTITVHVPAESRDKDGFVVEHSRIHDVMLGNFGVVHDYPSCEEIAIQSTALIGWLLKENNPALDLSECSVESHVTALPGTAGIRYSTDGYDLVEAVEKLKRSMPLARKASAPPNIKRRRPRRRTELRV